VGATGIPSRKREKEEIGGRLRVEWSEPGELIRCSDWLRAGLLRDRSSSPGRGKNFQFSISSIPALGPTEPPNQWILGSFPGG
jgi:hypothetical protein